MTINANRYKNLTAYEKILFNSVDETAIKLGDSKRNPISISLFLWKLGIDNPKAKDKIIHATLQIVMNADDKMSLTALDFARKFAQLYDVFTGTEKDTDAVIYILTWMGLNGFIHVYAVSQNIV
ncbi:hypothetical protein PUF88_06675 [Lactobacillaceae bacterium L1_55_11]|nr:hypothetical protein [Lactobacillaceae bacterium L1_55_11]